QDIIETVFGVVLFTLLVQGLTTRWFLEKLNLIGDQPLRQQYSEVLARRIALNRVRNYLEEGLKTTEIDSDLWRYQTKLIDTQLTTINDEIKELRSNHPELETVELEQLQETMLDIEADTYAEFIRSGRLNENLSPIMQQVLIEADQKTIDIENVT
ncbi:MAG: sodium:proton antiporter, partial [Moorea sp. SIO4A1]|nr:sodium:proton antiporter [Moorena sp. SIO4A1]